MTGSRSDTRSAGRKPRLGEIATPGRVCPPHNETYDCRLRPNGIGCGGSGAGRLPDRPDRSRHSGPIRHPNATIFQSAALGFRSGRTESPGGLQFRQRAEKRERKERERDEVPPGAVSIRRRTALSGDRTGNAAGERSERPRVRLGLAEPGSEEGSCDRSPGSTGQSCLAETPGEPGISANPITHFVTPAILGGVFGPYFPMAGNPLAWSRLENTCTWHIRYINAYDRSAKYFSIPKPG